MIRVEIRRGWNFFTTKIGNTWIMSVSIHSQQMGDTRSRRHRALNIRLHASALNRKLRRFTWLRNYQTLLETSYSHYN